MKRLIGACGVCLAVVGCGGGGKTGGPPATVSDFCASYTAAVDGVLERCLKVPKDAISGFYGRGNAQFCANMAAAVATKRATYDAPAAKTCLDQLKSLACTDEGTFFGPTDICSKAVVGQVADGGKCYDGLDCKASSYCSGLVAGTCPGTCTADVAKNGACSSDKVCAQGLECSYDVCQPTPAKGDACGGSYPSFCQPGLYCTGPIGAFGSCKTQKGPGASCSTSTECLAGFACIGGKCAALLGLGKSCTRDTDCGFFSHCSSGTCTEDSKLGGTCGADSQNSYIECIGSWCKITSQSTMTGVCTAYLSPGDACSPSDWQSCDLGVCDASTDKCLAVCMEPSS